MKTTARYYFYGRTAADQPWQYISYYGFLTPTRANATPPCELAGAIVLRNWMENVRPAYEIRIMADTDALLADGSAEQCPACDGISVYAGIDEDAPTGRLVIPAASCYEWTCAHCRRSWTPADSPLTADVYTHVDPAADED